MSLLVNTTRFTRARLPHWEIERGSYFVTLRCADSLPLPVVIRLRDVQKNLTSIAPASPQFAQLQRQYFLTMEKYLDAGTGECLLNNAPAADTLFAAFLRPSDAGVSIPHFTIMPNHCHALFMPAEGSSLNLHATLTQFKGRTARAINAALGRTGPFWQREWFDRWIRSDAEWTRCVNYIQQNPVKARLVKRWEDHPWTR